ncbi:hypothetical protein [Pedobacter sp.]|jgi:hypothetical protein|uniref:hypothetical protein n=1 Tax=Pedobacter sp. TaxID=1411316 RepID=UPI002C5CCB8A|nr:hypothetical protein [Pedobacter sp.]HWW41915.1 hypothetical protein [Pedobacter sp.]
MEKPVIFIHDSIFYIDVDKRRFVLASDLEHTCSFDLLLPQNNCFVGLFDHQTLQFVPVTPSDTLSSFAYNTTIPNYLLSLKFIEDIEFAKVLNKTSLRKNWNILIKDHQFHATLHYKLPQIALVGTPFVVHADNMTLVELDNPANVIDFKPLSYGIGRYEFVYDFIHKRRVIIDHKTIRFPENVVVLRVPNFSQLDPIGLAIKLGHQDASIWRSRLFYLNTKATEIPLSETNLEERIRRNQIEREAQCIPKQHINKKITPIISSLSCRTEQDK